ncbi:MAG: FMN-binding protein [Vicinamibacterales bacterium]
MRRVSNGLVGLGSAAVLTIYGAGYLRTRPAAARIALAAERRPMAAAAVAHDVPVAAPLTSSTPAPVSAPATPPSTVPSPATPTVPAASKPRVTRAPRAVARAVSDDGPASSTPPPRTAAAVAAPVAAAVHAPSASAAVQDLPPVAAVTPEPAAAPAAAPAPVAAPPAASAPTLATRWKDGTFLGWGTSRHGDIQASVEVRDGRIVSATIAQCLTRYSCSWISPLPPQVVARQSPETDYVSGATQSTNAFYYAVVDALSKAK